MLKMGNKIKDIDIKIRTYFFFDDIINVKSFDPSNVKLDEMSYKNILIYYIGYVMINDQKNIKINSVNPLYLIFNKVNRYLEEINKNKYLTLVTTNDDKEMIKNMKNCGVKSEI